MKKPSIKLINALTIVYDLASANRLTMDEIDDDPFIVEAINKQEQALERVNKFIADLAERVERVEKQKESSATALSSHTQAARKAVEAALAVLDKEYGEAIIRHLIGEATCRHP